MKIDGSWLTSLREATRVLQTKGPLAATRAIQKALGLGAGAAAGSKAAPGTASRAPPRARTWHPTGWPHERTGAAVGERDAATFEATQVRERTPDPAHPPVAERDPGGTFERFSHSGPAGARDYKLYLPRRPARERLPLLVMLHGCTQDPDDFAVGTAANRLADQHGCMVLYPEQSRIANQNLCWNWYSPANQSAAAGEPAIIAAMVREVLDRHRGDTARVYAAGMSAGGAMVTLLGLNFPRLFAAIGVHSGLPAGIARDLGSALMVMKRGPAAARSGLGLAGAVPTIVFHGDRDRVVHPRNGEALAQACATALEQAREVRSGALTTTVEEGRSDDGRTYTRTRRSDRRGVPLVEHWLVHDGRHAWSGGSLAGTHTDPVGPDATRDMWAFFRQHKH